MVEYDFYLDGIQAGQHAVASHTARRPQVQSKQEL